MSRQPDGPPPPPVVQRLRVRYAKRGRLRFTSHRDVARAIERGLRRAELPMAFSAGFSPHPKISYAGAAPTGVASEAEYLEIGLAAATDPEQVRARLDAALPAGLDVVQVVEVAPQGPKSLGERIEASHWRIELPEVSPQEATAALERFLALAAAPVDRPTKDGHRTVDARAAIEAAGVLAAPETAVRPAPERPCATLDLVVRHTTPAVRPDDILTALRSTAALTTPVTPVVTRLAQGLVPDSPTGDARRLIDPLA